MSIKDLFRAFQVKSVPAKDWKGEDPNGDAVTVLEHSVALDPSKKSGVITFKVKATDDTVTTVVGTITDKGAESVSVEGATKPDGDIDGGVAAHPDLRNPFKIRVRFTLIVKLRYDDTTQEDGVAEWRFEGKFGSTAIPGLGN